MLAPTEATLIEQRPSELVIAALAASRLLRGAAAHVDTSAAELDIQDFSMLGETLEELTRALAIISARCAATVGHYPCDHIFREDTAGRDPLDTCARASANLRQVAQHFGAANWPALQFHNAVSHLAVDVQW